ncbi:MAG TPA: hypothetical protein VNW54_13480 [Granulicella sp.]|jgi:hypothetical protein|nr:hypothetical protein [Granulicella sp.]
MSLPDPASPVLTHHGLHLVHSSLSPTQTDSTYSSNLLYRIAAIGAALFLVITAF